METGATETGSIGAGSIEAGVSRTDEVYGKIRREIVRGDLRPRESLSEVELAERLHVSRTPVRESLHRLASEGLITSYRRRWIVYEHSKAEIAEIYEVRAALESYAARLAALRATDAELAAIAQLRDAQAAPETTRPGDARVSLNEQVHDGIIQLAHNDALLREARASRRYFFNRTVAGLYTAEDMLHSAAQHAALIEAVLARDPGGAETAAREHIEYALEIILHRLP